jgi:hypothetical protein
LPPISVRAPLRGVGCAKASKSQIVGTTVTPGFAVIENFHFGVIESKSNFWPVGF